MTCQESEMSLFGSTMRARSPRAATRESFVQLEAHAGRDIPRAGTDHAATRIASSEGLAVVQFWREAGANLWFAKNAAFDREFRERFLPTHEAAARGELGEWLAAPYQTLALLLLLDQFPRNAFRGTPRMYASDELAREMAAIAIDRGHDQKVDRELRVFMYLPFGHSESAADQDRSIALNEHLGEPNLSHARRHRDIVRRFGRFPHRNPILGRTMTPEEQRFLDEGGYAG
jgi:uncharacterized protein (DUF924 family)